MSGNYDPATWNGWGERGEAAYFNNPLDYVAHLGGDHLDWLRARLSLLLVCGQGQWEDTTGALGVHQAPRRRARGARASATSSTCGGTTSRTTGRRGAPRLAHHLPTVLLMSDATHLIGLLLGTEEDWPRAFETLLARVGPIKDARGTTHHRDAPSGSRSSRSTCATSRATTSSSTGSPTGTTSRASG